MEIWLNIMKKRIDMTMQMILKADLFLRFYIFLFSEQPTASEPEATTRRPTRPRNFDPRRQRVSINAANSLPTGEPTIIPNIKLVKESVVKS